MKQKKVWLSLFVVLVALVAAAMMTQVSAETIKSGTCGDNLTWTLDSNKTLTIRGAGSLEEEWFVKNLIWSDGESYGFYEVDSLVIEEGITGIGSRFFVGVPMKSVSIPSSVKTIGDGAFGNSTSLERVVISNGLTNIPDMAFSGCTKLKSITIPPSVESIGSQAFTSCAALEDIVIPGTVKSIGSYAFAYCSALKNLTLSKGIENVSDLCFQACNGLISVTVPGSIQTFGIGIFSKCANLERVILQPGLTTIGAGMFEECEKLKDVSISNTVESIQDRAFYNCSGLTEIVIPDSVSVIGNPSETAIIAFGGCSSLESVVLPVTATVSIHTFGNCPNLKKIRFTAGCDGVMRTGNTHQTHLALDSSFSSVTEVVFDEGVKTIEDSAFMSFRTLKKVTIPDSVELIGDYAFAYTALETIAIPEMIQEIGQYVFFSCDSLETVTMGNGIKRIGSGAFANCVKLTRVKWSDRLEEIDDFAFQNCSNLTSLSFPDTLRRIGRSVFYGCTSLEDVTIPQYTESVEDGAFYGCTTLKNVTILSEEPCFVKDSFEYAQTEELCMPVTNETGGCLVRFCKDVLRLTPGTDGNMRFNMAGCIAQEIIVESGVHSITDNAFSYGKMTSVSLPDSITGIGERAFSACTDLKSINLPSGLVSLNTGVFSGCGNLDRIIIPSSVNTIKSAAFSNCGFTNLVIPDSVESIEESAFYRCNGLKSLVLPVSATVGSNAFSDCSHLQKIRYTVGSNGIMKECAFKLSSIGDVLEEVTFDYGIKSIKNMSNCKGLTSIVVPSSVTSIGEETFSGCINLKTATILGNIAEISNNLFSGCTKLASVTIPGSVSKIGKNAFTGCTSLSGVSIPGNVTSIGEYAFYNCDGITSITIPSRVSVIEDSTFSSCAGLANLTLPKSIKTICAHAFSSCSKLKNVYYAGTESQWQQVSVGSDNYPLTEADYHYAPSYPSTPHTHVYGSYVPDGNANCQKDGTKTATCIYCYASNTVVDPGSKTGHRDSDGDGKCDYCAVAIPTVENPGGDTPGGTSGSGTGVLQSYATRKVTRTIASLLGAPPYTYDAMEITVLINGNAFVVSESYDLKETDVQKLVGSEVVYTLTNGKLTMLKGTESYLPTPHPSLQKPEILSYEGNRYSKNSFDLKGTIHNTMHLDRLPDGVSQDDILGNTYNDLGLSVESIELESSKPELLYFEGGENNGATKKQTFNSILGVNKTQLFTQKVTVRTSYKIDPSVPEEEVVIQCVLRGAENGKPIEKFGSTTVVIQNRNYVAPEPGKETKTLEKLARKAAEETDSIAKQIAFRYSDLDALMNKDQLRAVKNAIILEIMSASLPKETFVNCADKKLVNQLFSVSSKIDFANNSFDIVVCVDNPKNKGTLEIKFTVSYSITIENGQPVGYTSLMNEGGIRYEIVGGTGLKYIPTYKRSGNLGELSIGNVSGFFTAVRDYILEQVQSGYNVLYGNNLNEACDLVFGKCVSKIMKRTDYGSVSGLLWKKMVTPTLNEYEIQCPVDVYVYNDQNELVASVENDEITYKADNVDVELNGAEKTIRLWGEDYTLKYVAYADGDMQVTVKECCNSDIVLRTLQFNDVPLRMDRAYTQSCYSTILDPESDYTLYCSEGNKTPDLIEEAHIHSADIVTNSVEATCSEDGWRLQYCATCQEWYKEWESALGHGDENGDNRCDRCGSRMPGTFEPGDINGDGTLNNKDLNRLMKHLAGEEVEVVEAALDINGDGTVNNKDLNRLMKYLAGENVEIH